MKMNTWIAALAACVLLPAAAQSVAYTPSAAEVKHARENASRDAKLADEMEKARLKEEAGSAAVYIPKEVAATESPKAHKPAKLESFTATVPGSGKKVKETAKASAKESTKAKSKEKQKKAQG